MVTSWETGIYNTTNSTASNANNTRAINNTNPIIIATTATASIILAELKTFCHDKSSHYGKSVEDKKMIWTNFNIIVLIVAGILLSSLPTAACLSQCSVVRMPRPKLLLQRKWCPIDKLWRLRIGFGQERNFEQNNIYGPWHIFELDNISLPKNYHGKRYAHKLFIF